MNNVRNKQILIADKIHRSGISLLKKNKFEIHTHYNLSNSALIRKASQLNAGILLVRSMRKLDKEFIQRLKNESSVRLLCTASSGIDHIDARYAGRGGISVLNVPAGNYTSAAEHTFALILAAFKNLTRYNHAMKKGFFDNNRHKNFELSGKTIGIIGVGRVGSYVARIAAAFKLKILGNDIKKTLKSRYKWIKFTGLKNLLQSSDIVTMHVPLDSSTLNLINHKQFRELKKGSVFINCSRGGVVNEYALLKALERKTISYAGLDVFENEPHINRKLTKLNNVILTPHIAGKTKESIERVSILIAKSIANYVKREK